MMEPEKWWETLECKGFKISCRKQEYINSNFSEDVQKDATRVKIEAKEIPR